MNSLIPKGRGMKSAKTILTLALPAVLCVLAVAGCGSSKNAASTTTTTTQTTTGTTPLGSANFSAYQSCLQSHGVSFPQGGPSGGTNGGSPPAGGIGGGAPGSGRPSISAAQRKAFQACASLQPSGGGLGGGGGFGGGGATNSNSPAFAKFQNCLKQHGVDPTDSNARGSSAFQTALSACRSLLPSQGAGAGSGFGGGAPPGSGAAGSGNSSSFAKFQACLKSHGVNTGAAGQSSAKTQAAIATCQKLLQPTGSGTTTATG